VRAGVVGTGFIGAVHVEALRRLGIEVVGVVGSSRQRAQAKQLAPVIDSYEALLADYRIDVVHLTTPNHLHYDQVKQALAAGKHVVCEKPLALTSEQSSELLELAERGGLVHCTNFNIRFYPQVQQARSLVGGGEGGGGGGGGGG
jgi:predicted dehydrogenase